MIIVVTGKTGAGKKHISEILAQNLNGELLSLDKISHMSLKTENVKSFVAQNFGPSVIMPDGELDRKAIGKIAFSNPELLDKLNKTAENEMVKIIDDKIANSSKKYIILEYALLPLMKYFNSADVKILVHAADEVRKNRTIVRDKISEEYFLLRDKHSLSYNDADYDFIIENNELDSDYSKLSTQILNFNKKQ